MAEKLSSRIGQYKKYALLAPLFMAGEVTMEVIIPRLMADMIDLGIAASNMTAMVQIGAGLILTGGLALVFGILSGRYAAIASAGFGRNLRNDMYSQIQQFSFSNIDHFSTAGLVTRLTTDVSNLQNAFQMIIRIAVRSPLMLVLSIAMAFSIHARLALVFLLAAPILGISIYFLMTRAHPLFKRVFSLYEKLNNVVQENVRGIRVIKNFVREDHETDKFKHVSGEIHDNFVSAEKLLTLNAPIMQFCLYLCSILISWFGARLIVGEEMTTGQLTSMMSYSIQILMNLMMMSMVLVSLVMARTSRDRINEVLNESSDIHNGANADTTVTDGSITFRNVDFSYGGETDNLVLQGINLKIESGQTVGIIGGTGAGKSTLVQLIPRLYDTTAGEIIIGGRNVRDYDIESLRDQVAMVLQKNTLFSGTIKENLRWGNKQAADDELTWACKLAQAEDFILAFPEGYDNVIDQGGTNVSGGQKQRLCIARALLKRPKIIIFDDSTSAIDTRTDALIRESLHNSLPETTKIIIAQRIASVQESDLILVMNEGKIDAYGKHDDLLETSPIYREVYESQMKGSNQGAA